MEVYVVIEWFYDGDSYLVNYYLGVKKSYDEAILLNIKDYEILSDEDFEIIDGKREPKDFGSYGSKPKIEIRKEEV